MQVSVKLFAVASELAERNEIEFELADGSSIGRLRQELSVRLPRLAAILPQVMIAMDGEYSTDDEIIRPGVELAAIPPVSGG